jgi:hypothetical protein
MPEPRRRRDDAVAYSTVPRALFLSPAQAIRDGYLDEATAALAHAADSLTRSSDAALRARLFSFARERGRASAGAW